MKNGKKGNLGKALFSTLVTVLVVLLFLSGTYLLVMSGSGTEEEKEQAEPAEGQKQAPIEQAGGQSPEQFLQSFAEVLYTYDTRERRFYEGAEVFMTPQAYAELIPFTSGELAESGERPPAVVSSLQEAKCYYSCPFGTEAEVIMESRFTLSRSGNGQVMQYIRLCIEKQNDVWKITDIRVLDTLEQ